MRTGSCRALLVLAWSLACACASDDSATVPVAAERFPGGATTNTLLLGSNAFTTPAANITEEHEAAFFTGNSFFNQSWVQAPSSTSARDGLGPLFNARSCSSCHFKDGRGRPPLTVEEAFDGLLLRVSVPGAGEGGAPLPDPNYGGQLQPFAISGVPPEAVLRLVTKERSGNYADGEPYTLLEPSYEISEVAYGPLAADLQVSPRVAPAMIGLGLLEAIPLDRLLALVDPEDADGDGISGRLNQVWDVTESALVPGRFGWKAEQPSVRQQSAGAFLGDIGITTSLFPTEDCSASELECQAAVAGGTPELSDSLLDKVEIYAQYLAVPMRERSDDAAVIAGRRRFQEIGCASCHVPEHRTGELAGRPELSAQTIFPYTDLLLHDLGPELSDGRPVFRAEGSEWRTAPLWGLAFYKIVNGHDRLLHDGRARGVAEAILWHGGEAEPAREAFRNLPRRERGELVQFVESL